MVGLGSSDESSLRLVILQESLWLIGLSCNFCGANKPVIITLRVLALEVKRNHFSAMGFLVLSFRGFMTQSGLSSWHAFLESLIQLPQSFRKVLQDKMRKSS